MCDEHKKVKITQTRLIICHTILGKREIPRIFVNREASKSKKCAVSFKNCAVSFEKCAVYIL